jgi:alpha-galactosidase
VLEVGVNGQNGHSEGGLSMAEQRTHFGLWCVVSSPLTLSFDLGNASLMDAVWPIIANKDAIAVNQQWAGAPGTLADEDKDSAGARWQVWAKPQPDGAVAVLLVNMGDDVFTLSVVPSEFVLGSDGTVAVRDVWNGKDLGRKASATPLVFDSVAAHDSIFLVFTPTSHQN